MSNITQIHAKKNQLKSEYENKKNEKQNNASRLTEVEFEDQKKQLNKQIDRQKELVSNSYKQIKFIKDRKSPILLDSTMMQALEKYIKFLKAALDYFNTTITIISEKGVAVKVAAKAVSTVAFGFTFDDIKEMIEKEGAQLEKHFRKSQAGFIDHKYSKSEYTKPDVNISAPQIIATPCVVSNHSNPVKEILASTTQLPTTKPQFTVQQKEKAFNAKIKKLLSEIDDLFIEIQGHKKLLKKLQRLNKMFHSSPYAHYQAGTNIKYLFDPDNAYQSLAQAIKHFPRELQTQIINYQKYPHRRTAPTYDFFAQILNKLNSQVPGRLEELNKLYVFKIKELALENAKAFPQYYFLIAQIKKELRTYRSGTLISIADRTSYNNSFILEDQIKGLRRSALQASQSNGRSLSADQHYVNTTLKTLLHYRNLPDTSKAFRFAIDNVLYKFRSAHTNVAQITSKIQQLKDETAHYQTNLESFIGKYNDILNTAAFLRNENSLDSLFDNLGEKSFSEAIKDFSPHIKGKLLLNRNIRLASFPFLLWNESPYSLLVNCLKDEIQHLEAMIAKNNNRIETLQERTEIALGKEFTIEAIKKTQFHITTAENTAKELTATEARYSQAIDEKYNEKIESVTALLQVLHPKKKPEEAITDELTDLRRKRNFCIEAVSKNKTHLVQLTHDAELMKLKEKVYNFFERICRETSNLNTPKYIGLLKIRNEIKLSDDLEQVKSKIEEIKTRAKAHVDFSFFGLRADPMSYRAFEAHFVPADYAKAPNAQLALAF